MVENFFLMIEDFTRSAAHMYRERNQAANALSKMALKYKTQGTTNAHN